MRFPSFVALFLLSLPLCAQNSRVFTSEDTLLIIGGSLIDDEKFIINRNQLVENDSIFVNKNGWLVESFSVSAFALGQKINLKNNGNALSDEVKYHLTNKESIFKFFYLKDIILRTDDGRVASPSIRTVKITFTN